MSDEMDIAHEGQIENRKESSEEMELESESSRQSAAEVASDKCNNACDVADCTSRSTQNFQDSSSLKLTIPEEKDLGVKEKGDSPYGENCVPRRESADSKDSPPVFVNSQPFPQNLSDTNHSPFQKPTACRTHSVGGGDPSPFTIRRRPARLAFHSQLRSPSAFKRKPQSPIRVDLLDEMEDNVLKRCNSAPMLNDINDMDARMAWHHGSVTPGSIRVRRFSATVIPVHASPSAGSSKSTSRLAQLKKEESLEGIQHKETAHEREVQTSIQMYHTCEELSLSDTLNGGVSGGSEGSTRPPQALMATAEPPQRSPLPSPAPVTAPASSKQCPNRAIDFNLSSNHQGIPSPLTIPTGPQSLSPLPPSPTRNPGFSSTGKQCFSPSMQVPVPACLRPGSLSPSPSPTRRTLVTRRRSQSPCVLKPSAFGNNLGIKRKYDSDSEGGSSPKRMFVPGSQVNTFAGGGSLPGETFSPYSIVTSFFPRHSVHRSHSLSSSSIDSDINVSPSPPQTVNMNFLPATHPLVSNPPSRDSNTSSLFQSPLHNPNPYSNTVVTQELGRCSSPASSTCSSSSLEGLKDLPPFPQSHLVTHSSSNSSTPTLLKPPIKDRQSSVSSKSTANITL